MKLSIKNALRSITFRPQNIGGHVTIKIILWSIFSILIITIVLFAILIYGFKQDNKTTKFISKLVPYPAALVNNSPITLADFNFTRNYTYHYYDAIKTDFDADIKDRELMDQLADREIIAQQAKKQKIAVSKSEVDDAYAKLQDKNGKDELAKVLSDLYGINEKQFKTLIYNQVLKQKVQDYYEQNGLWYQFKVRHILIKVDSGADQKTIDSAKAKADMVLKLINGGKDFSAMAKEYTNDEATKENGGDLGYISRGKADPDFETAVFAAKKGDLLGPVRTQYGWHLMIIDDVRGDNDFSIWRTQAKIRKLI
jgi:hypothetical protein